MGTETTSFLIAITSGIACVTVFILVLQSMRLNRLLIDLSRTEHSESRELGLVFALRKEMLRKIVVCLASVIMSAIGLGFLNGPVVFLDFLGGFLMTNALLLVLWASGLAEDEKIVDSNYRVIQWANKAMHRSRGSAAS